MSNDIGAGATSQTQCQLPPGVSRRLIPLGFLAERFAMRAFGMSPGPVSGARTLQT
ncbi:hypothetical protein [Luteimonas saliphila]|uniref:hypothetical protein n=1 Tax=Luteimonas saliphila TaxID=2804919 RepID=UPI00192D74E0|nr:hypothetical protein [Luteimonas saliphila]